MEEGRKKKYYELSKIYYYDLRLELENCCPFLAGVGGQGKAWEQCKTTSIVISITRKF